MASRVESIKGKLQRSFDRPQTPPFHEFCGCFALTIAVHETPKARFTTVQLARHRYPRIKMRKHDSDERYAGCRSLGLPVSLRPGSSFAGCVFRGCSSLNHFPISWITRRCMRRALVESEVICRDRRRERLDLELPETLTCQLLVLAVHTGFDKCRITVTWTLRARGGCAPGQKKWSDQRTRERK